MAVTARGHEMGLFRAIASVDGERLVLHFISGTF